MLPVRDDLNSSYHLAKKKIDTWAGTSTAHGRLMLTVIGGWPNSSGYGSKQLSYGVNQPVVR